MNTTLFITTHLGSGYNELVSLLNEHSRIQIQDVHGTYEHITDIKDLVSVKHKMNSVASIYGDILIYNYQFCFDPLLKFGKFVYLIRDPKSSLNKILNKKQNTYSELAAFRYYSYRLRRICEMAKRTPKAVVLTWRDLLEDKATSLIEDYLQMDLPSIRTSSGVPPEDVLSYDILKKAEDCYERHLYYLKHLQLRCSS